jgi:hypothetical protein
MNKRFPGQGRSCDINIKKGYSKEDKFSRNILIYFNIKQHSTKLNLFFSPAILISFLMTKTFARNVL